MWNTPTYLPNINGLTSQHIIRASTIPTSSVTMADDDDVTAQECSVREADPTGNASGNDGGQVGVVAEGGDVDAAGHGGGRGRRPSSTANNLSRGRGQRGRGRGGGRRPSEGGRRPGEDGQALGRSNYSAAELDVMLESVREILPISGAEWELVASRHLTYYGDVSRTGDQLRKKFGHLSKTTIPTGDPNCPLNVQEAKAIRQLIIEKLDGATGSNEDVFSPDDEEAPLEEAEEDELDRYTTPRSRGPTQITCRRNKQD